MEALQVIVLPTNTGGCRHSSLCLAIVAAINVHPHDIFACGFVIDDLWALDDSVGTQISATLTRQQLSNEVPFDQVGARIAIHGLESASIKLVFTDPVIHTTDFDNA